MCGIYGVLCQTNTIDLINSLQKLEYRGYDSCGIAYKSKENTFMFKTVGNTSKLKEKVAYSDLSLAIGHTRWATHGGVSEKNAHPHHLSKDSLYVVHNGVIDNFRKIKEKYNFKFYSDTDSEIICHLLNYYRKDNSILDALKTIAKELSGSYAIVIMDSINNGIYFLKNKSPLLIGKLNNKTIISSDQCVFDEGTYITVLNDMSYGYFDSNSINVYSLNKENKNYKFKKEKDVTINKINDYYMLDEMYYEIEMIKDIAEKYKFINNRNFIDILNSTEEVCFMGAGSSYYASKILAFYYEKRFKKRCHSIIASEFYNFNILYKNTAFIILSQSGETADLIEPVDYIKNHGFKSILLCNNVNSTLGYKCDIVFPLFAKTEVSVASTKAFTAMVYVGILLINKNYCCEGETISSNLKSIFSKWDEINRLAKQLSNSKLVFFMGKGIDYPLALEGALKLREITYLHSFAFEAGELKHGSIALIDSNTSCIAIITDKTQASKLKNSLEEVRSRGACVYSISNCDIDSDYYVEGDILSIVLFLQILAYKTALLLKRNIDQPRNLAKSVTVQ